MKKFKQFLSRRKTIVGLSILLILLIFSLLSPILRPGNPLFSVSAPLQRPSAEFPFGTDNTGADVLAMLLWGGRVSMMIAFGAAGISLIIGIILGAISGYIGGVVDDILSRFFELFYIIPRTFLVILMVAVFGSSIHLVTIIIGLTIWPSNAKIMRAQVLTLKSRGYVDAAKVAGVGRMEILRTHIIPNGIGPILSNSTLQMAQAVLTEASISFLGLGDPNLASWGKVLQAGQKHISTAPWLVIIPGMCIAVLILSFNFLSDSLHSVLNTKTWE